MDDTQAPTSDPLADRRPIASRSWGVFQAAAAWLTRRGVTPNAISVSSMVFAGLAGLAFWATAQADGPVATRLCWLAAGAGVQLRLIANLLDGMVAVEGGKGSPTGSIYNEAPDRVADAAILLGAGWAAGGAPWLGAAATMIALFVAYVRALGASVGVGQVFVGPMAKPQRMAAMTLVAAVSVVSPTVWGLEQRTGFGLMAVALAVMILGGVATAARRLAVIARRLREADPQ